MRKMMRSDVENNDKVPCYFCQGRYFNLLISALDFDNGKESFDLMECAQCRLVRTEPILSPAQLQKYYALPYYGAGKEKFKGLAETITYWLNYRRAGVVLSHLESRPGFSAGIPPRILDVGCGRGNLLRILNDKGCACYGVERTDFPENGLSKGIHFFKGNLNELLFEDNFFDAVVLWHVLEHTENPIGIVQETARILHPGGLLVVAVPNFGSFQAKLFQAEWFHLDLPRHTYHFSSETLLQCLSRTGFEVIKRSTFSIEQNPFGFIQSFFNKIPRAKPNRFYSLLKKIDSPSSFFSLLVWAGFAFLIFPFALLEYLISGILGKGATLLVYAKKH